MRALIVYESMYGNTHAIAAQIANGMRAALGEVELVAAHEVTREQVAVADVLVVGGPTHAHGMTSAATRRSARDTAHMGVCAGAETGTRPERTGQRRLRPNP